MKSSNAFFTPSGFQSARSVFVFVGNQWFYEWSCSWSSRCFVLVQKTPGVMHSLAWGDPIACGWHVCQSFCNIAVLLGALRIQLLWIHTIQIMLLCRSTIVGPQACSQRSARTEPQYEHSPRTKAEIKVRSKSS